MTALLVAGFFALTFTSAATAQPRESRRIESRGREFVTKETDRAIRDGLAYLAARQHPDGSFGSGSIYRQNVAVTSLCGMAFLSSGSMPGRGPHGKVLQKTVDFILSRCKPSGFITEADSVSHGPMYGHGFATLFLAEVYGMTPRKDVREKLSRAVRLIVNTQNDEGGWRYYPVRDEADVSVTVCQMMALRAARNCGIHVPKETVERCVDYIKRCQNADGGFRYRIVRGESMFPRSAAAVVGLFNAGEHDTPELKRAMAFLFRHRPRGNAYRYEAHYFYGHYYAAQAMWHAGETEDYWERWYPAIRDELVTRQLPGGGWADSYVCTEYGTAMACLVLQVPNTLLPIFQR